MNWGRRWREWRTWLHQPAWSIRLTSPMAEWRVEMAGRVIRPEAGSSLRPQTAPPSETLLPSPHATHTSYIFCDSTENQIGNRLSPALTPVSFALCVVLPFPHCSSVGVLMLLLS